MKSYTFDVKFVGYEQVTVKAASLEEAEEKAAELFDNGMQRPMSVLTTKSVSLDQLGGDE